MAFLSMAKTPIIFTSMIKRFILFTKVILQVRPKFEKLFDFSLALGDTIFLYSNTYEVTGRDTIRLLDNKDRISLTLNSVSNPSRQLDWVEGIGNADRGSFFNEYNSRVELKCVSIENGPIYVNGVTENECRSMSCRLARASFEFQHIDDKIEIENTSKKLIVQEWDFGDGNTSSEVSPSHQYTDFGCYNIQLTGRDTCGNVFSSYDNLNYCVDSNWVNIQLYFPEVRDFNNIDYMTRESALAITYDSIFQTQDGDKTWESLITNFVTSGDTVSYLDLDMYNENFGLMCGYVNQEAKVFRTIDGGSTWTETLSVAYSTQVQTDDNYFLAYLPFENLFYISDDFGVSWIEKEVPYFDTYFDFQVIDGHIFVVGYNRWVSCQKNNAIFANSSLDTNSDWTTQDLPLYTSFQGGGNIQFIDKTKGFISLANRLLKTEDGGNNWEEVSLPAGSSVSDIVFLNEDIGWLAGQSFLRTIDGGETWNNDYCQFGGSVKKGSLQVIEETMFCDIRGYGVFQRAPEEFFECKTNAIFGVLNTVETKVFPNPSTDMFVIDPGVKFGVAEVITQEGASILKQRFNEDQFEIDLGGQIPGMYFLRIISEKSVVSLDKIIKIK